ncbi:fungal-specific transcription factor domain-containing protein [Armillaria fumosa]|nr:fungal-specific transcription factor domain-containing protein [Armillaria fumosa]
MSCPTSSYCAHSQPLRPPHDAYDLWYQQHINIHDNGLRHQLTQQGHDQHLGEQQQSDSYNNHDHLPVHVRYQSHLPNVSSAQQPTLDKKNPPSVKDGEGESNDSGNDAVRRRPGGACIQCKKIKMKCDFPPGERACKRCKPKGYKCVIEAPKPKVYKRDLLLAEIRRKDAVIESLLKQLYNPYLATPHSIDEYLESISPVDANNLNALAWLDRLNSRKRTNAGSSFISVRGEKEQSNPLTHGDWEAQEDEQMFSSRKEAEKEHENVQSDVTSEARKGSSEYEFNLDYAKEPDPPDILALGLVTLEEAEPLFNIFYTYINPFISILDPILLTPKSTLARCPVLFTVICAIASRYHPPKSSIYPIAMRLAKHSAANALVQDEMKSVELCQAYILMSIYAVPERSWDRDLSWLYTGVAISMATDLRLYQSPTTEPVNEPEEREALNRVRVWLLCFNFDQATAVQFGRPWIMKEDTIIHHSEEWYKKSQYNLDYDMHLCGYNSLLRIVARFHREVFSDRSRQIHSERVDLRSVTMRYDVEIDAFKEEWKGRFAAGGARRGAVLGRSQLHFYVLFYKLVVFSFGFHQVFHTGIEAWYDYFFSKCFEYAKSVVRHMNEELASSGFMRYAPDRHFMCAAFASVFLFKLLRPEFSPLLDKADENQSIDLIVTLIDKFSSSDIAVDDRHTPKLYAKFLATLLRRHNGPHGMGSKNSRIVPPRNINVTGNIIGDKNGDGDEHQELVAFREKRGPDPGYQLPESQTRTSMPQMTQSADIWPIRFVNGTELLPFTYGSGIINGSSGVGNQGGMEDDVFASIQVLNDSEWFRGMAMPGFTWFGTDSSEHGQSTNYSDPATGHIITQ